MSKRTFKIGERVVSLPGPFDDTESLVWHDDMANLAGVVECGPDVDGDYGVKADDSRYELFDPSWLRLDAESASPAPTFKVGDRVVTTTETCGVPAGTEGEVREIAGHAISVALPGYPRGLTMFPSEIAPATAPSLPTRTDLRTSVEIMDGDRAVFIVTDGNGSEVFSGDLDDLRAVRDEIERVRRIVSGREVA